VEIVPDGAAVAVSSFAIVSFRSETPSNLLRNDY